MGRIIAGRHRGHRIAAPTTHATRPTTDRVRESVFAALISWLGRASDGGDSPLRGISFLDLYAGSGAVGLEAASRGAAPVVLVERDARVAAVAQANARSLGTPVRVSRGSVGMYLAGAAHPYDVVWLDPPYDLGGDELAGVLRLVVDAGWLADDGLVMVERSSRTTDPQFPVALADSWSRRYGETTVWFATRHDAAASDADDPERDRHDDGGREGHMIRDDLAPAGGVDTDAAVPAGDESDLRGDHA